MYDDPNVVLHCEKIDKIYPGTKALDQVSFDLLKGKVNVLIGENGAGKSTLMKMIAGIEQPSAGKMYMDGEEVFFKDTNAARAKGIGIIHQELSLFPNLTVYQNIFDLFSQAVEGGQPLPDANLFAMHEDNMVRNTALSLMINSYTVSKQWYEKKHITVPHIETHLREDLDQSILTFKQKKVDQMLEANGYKIRECKSQEDTDLLLAERQQLIEVRKALCEKLNRVIV